MITLNQLIFDCLGTISASDRISDDSSISEEHIKFLILNNRVNLIKMDLQKGRSISDNITQILPCVNVIKADNSECCEISTNCNLLRTESKIPRPLELGQKDIFTRISGVDRTGIGFSIISYARASVAGTSKWTRNTPKAFFQNGYIYLMNPPNINKISVNSVFQDPTEAAAFSTCSGTLCYSDDSEFPISSWMIPALKELVLKDLKIQVSVPSDTTGDESQKTQSQIEK